jgi:hypothetical protein
MKPLRWLVPVRPYLASRSGIDSQAPTLHRHNASGCKLIPAGSGVFLYAIQAWGNAIDAGLRRNHRNSREKARIPAVLRGLRRGLVGEVTPNRHAESDKE